MHEFKPHRAENYRLVFVADDTNYLVHIKNIQWEVIFLIPAHGS